ncbi:trans-1,2-dihydrobenzene-1,2-diol dehydrogenase-like [Topomyia yanbarensis]|uniref:trans-1,2-dihydrobenzene-1,2-diol dehydrogenase-like n=1 Tax=Topomyia yanbarensis TaxID=2498891 RepID=UPI00273CE7FD|nr:trans-1,2-dihydrobenzene-1,2-diol dehydrogenase-like [Topomyia yanbarensis]
MSPLRWGVVTAGTVVHDFVCAISTLPECDHKVVAVAASGRDSVQKFAELHGIPSFYVGFEALAKNPHIDIVYIGAVNSVHYEVAMKMLEAGKHVLCEKPLCVNEGQSKALLNYARERKLFCMEAIWSRFFPSYNHVRERIRKGDLGNVKEIIAELGSPASKMERNRIRQLGGGSVFEKGFNNIQLALWAFQEAPDKIVVNKCIQNADNDYTETNVDLHFPSGGVAKFKTSAVKELSNVAVITGSKGSIKLHEFCCPIELTDIDGTVRFYPLPSSNVECIMKNSVGLRFEAEECRKRILAGDSESQVVTHANSLAIARVQDAIRKRLGIETAEDYTFKS